MHLDYYELGTDLFEAMLDQIDEARSLAAEQDNLVLRAARLLPVHLPPGWRSMSQGTRGARVEAPAREHHVQRRGEPHQARQALRPAKAGDQPELNLREPDLRARIERGEGVA